MIGGNVRRFHVENVQSPMRLLPLLRLSIMRMGLLLLQWYLLPRLLFPLKRGIEERDVVCRLTSDDGIGIDEQKSVVQRREIDISRRNETQ